ncbi:phospholipase/carboxylesterase [Sanguibacter gelidistatuariae]|uniref:Phospholipase/carboxylesterase n=1 Tax=Sanguibacter gelidistatuariae TaxID=1814289 RepID=A0A1G6RU82_9MICO|nr:dienelactone hydrolase family protein [Sanguibacter gelidistatuariae]SDD07506.1 phospholipase/carboxylesterase [Sanguibacter gelidistatuariae]
MTTLSADAAIWSGDPRSETPLLLLMHGYGSHESDLLGLTPHLPAELATVSVRAPLPAGMGYAWVPIADPGRPDPAATQDAADAILAWLDDAVPASTPVALLGFSQGGLMVTHLLRSRPERFFAGVVLSGFTADDVVAGDDALAAIAPPVFFGRGDRDQIISEATFARTSDWLPRHTTTTEVVYPGLGHGITSEEIEDVAAFLRAHLPG